MAFTTNEKEILQRPDFVNAINKLTDLLQQNKRIFVIGAGCSKPAGLPLMYELTTNVLDGCKGSPSHHILTHIKDEMEGKGTIEDYLSELIDLLAITQRRSNLIDDSVKVSKIDIGGVKYDTKSMRETIEEIKGLIKTDIDKQVSIEVHRKFIQHVHNAIRPGKYTVREKVDYIILNYDTLIEDSLAFENISYVDGLTGGSSAYWFPQVFADENAIAKVIKLHGSIDWTLNENENFPRRISTRTNSPHPTQTTLIYPATTKYIETQVDPFAKLFDIARSSLRCDKDMQKAIITIGYSFGDAHVNRELETALNNSDGHLTIIIFIPDESQPTVKRWLASSSFGRNVLVFSNNGTFHADKPIAKLNPGESIEWWKFEKLTDLLSGEI